MAAKTILPSYLQPGIVSIYGAASIYGLRGNKDIMFGRVYQSYSNPIVDIIGKSVMFKAEDSIQISNDGTPLILLPENKILLIEKEL